MYLVRNVKFPFSLPAPHRWPIASLLLFACLLYIVFPTKQFYWDGVKFALRIQSFPHSPQYWTDPNHLIYTFLGGVPHYLLQSVGLDISPLCLLQTVDILAGLAGILFFHALALHIRVSPLTRFAATVAFAFSAAWWNYSVDISSYVVSTDFLMLSALILLRLPRRWPVLLAASLAIATLLHQIAVIFVAVPIMLAVRNRQLAKSVSLSLLSAGAISFGAQIVAYIASGPDSVAIPSGVVPLRVYDAATEPGFLGWLFAHSTDSGFSWSIPHAIAGLATGTLKSFFGGKLSDFRYVPIVVPIAASLILVCAIVILHQRRRWLLQLAGGPAPSAPEAPAHVLTVLSVWIAAYIVLLFFWMPGSSFYRLFYFPPLLLGLAKLADARVRLRPVTAFSVLVLCIAWNFVMYVFPHAQAERNEPLMAALRLREAAEPDTQVFYRDFNTDNWLIRYVNRDTGWFAYSGLASLPAGQAVWMEGTAWEALQHSTSRSGCIIVLRDLSYQGERRNFTFHQVRRPPACTAPQASILSVSPAASVSTAAR